VSVLTVSGLTPATGIYVTGRNEAVEQ